MTFPNQQENPALDALCAHFLDRIPATPDTESLTLGHLDLLFWVGEHSSVTRRQAHRKFGGSAARTARRIRVLVRRGLLERRRDSRDCIHLRLSVAGHVLISRIEATRRRLCGSLLERLSPEEQATLARDLRPLLPDA